MDEMTQLADELQAKLREFPWTKKGDAMVGEWNALVKVREAVLNVIASRTQASDAGDANG